jgi:membrane protease subunit (stomatin/prohibitin family)
MGLKSWLFGDFIDTIEWKDNNKEELFFEFLLNDKEISYNAKLKVNEGEIAIFALNSNIFDTFTYGEYLLNRETLPNIAKELNWDSNYDEPFKLDVYFLNRDTFTFYWDTKEPILLHDKDNSIAKVEAMGTFEVHVYKIKLFLDFILKELDKDNYKNIIKSIFNSALIDALVNRKSSIYLLASNKDDFSQYVYSYIIESFQKKGLMLDKITTTYIEAEQELPNYTGIYEEDKKDIYYIIKNSKPDGPYTKDDILNFIDNGTLIAASYIWKNGLENWVRVKDLFDLN